MRKFVKDVLTGFEDAIAYAQGDKSRGVLTTITIPDIDVKSIRKKTGLTQEAFSRLFAIKTRTLQDWEQNRRKPEASARIFLLLIDRHPSTIRKTLKSFGYSLETRKPSKAKTKTLRKPSKKFIDPITPKNKLIKIALKKK